ncbi:MAG TPA: 2-dehydropantoate 2-reductase N-terminal domain-containing protein [Anaerolineales bacterium]|nr:2-dehydropantoate 2-reductase N-terminal domain-containing protein [Anaerolineales bacterium]
MDTKNPRILVIGAGVNGSAVATQLYNAKLDVKVLARGKRYEEIKDEGIIIEDPFNRKRSTAKVNVINYLAPDDIYDYILVIVRKNQIADLLPVLAQNKSANIVFMGNNLSGPEEFTKIVVKQRIMLGTVVAGGKREADIIRAFTSTPLPSPFGEIDGTITPRLKELVKILNSAGINAKPSKNMIDFQMTHAAGVAIVGKLTMKYHCDLHAFARCTKDLQLIVDARREAHQVLRALGHKIVPSSEDFIRFIPRFLQVAGMRALLNSKLGEVGLAYHVSQAPDEMQQLAMELRALVEQTNLPVPAIREVLAAKE